MNPSYIYLICLWMILFNTSNNRKKATAITKIIQKRKSGGNTEMKELAMKFIGQNCTIHSFDGNKTYKGVIQEVTDGAILLLKGDKTEVLNLDFISRIQVVEKKG